LVHGQGQKTEFIEQLFDASYAGGISDEFIEPHVLNNGKIENGDVVIFFNFRTDRPRELTTALTQQAFPEQNMAPMELYFVTMTQYDEQYKNIHIVFENDNLENTLGEVISKTNKSQIRIAETEKYPHVTFFFNGGREIPFDGETRIMVNSPKVATYDLQPEMSALEVRNKLIAALQDQAPDFFCLNFANPDMVGHTGVYAAILKAVETVDGCLGAIVEAAKDLGYELIIIADHGNADFAVNEDGSPNTAHSLNPVPIIHVTENNSSKIKDGILADVAPTILKIMGIEQAEVMSGKVLIY
jgi:2,3-bisphosphoglycerate-independent phosphoglycerate mutase